MLQKIKNNISTKVFENKLYLLLILYFIFKSGIAYIFDFSLGISGLFQVIIAVFSLIAISSFLYGLAFISKNKKVNKLLLIFFNALLTLLLIANVYYYREFSDFLTIDTVLKATSNSSGLTGSAIKMINWYDFLFILDLILLPIYLFKNKKQIYKKSYLKTPISLLLCFFTLTLAEIDRPQLLSRSFDNNYLVKYLGLSGFTIKNISDYNQLKVLRADATENDLIDVENFIKNNGSGEVNKYTGIAKDRNVVYIHLESLQQFIIDYKLEDENGLEHEVTPYLNKIFHSKDTISFDNAFHQVSQGKTSDAEFMIENSIFGSESGSAMVKFGTENTFNSSPNILKKYGYTSQVFHGNTDTFWNRNNAYKSFGYDNFYSLKTYKNQEVINYGLKDDVFFEESLDKYLQIGGKKYSKFIPVSHHFPYDKEKLDSEFPSAQTKDETINNYFVTANYMDTQIQKFMEGLKENNELNNTIFVFYGDHYGISNSRNTTLNEVLNITEDWTGYNNAMMQRIPLMFYIPNSNINSSNEINHKYVGQIDILPTLLNMIGVNSDNLLFFGQDIFSKNYDNVVEFRDGGFVTDEFTYYKVKTYNTETGELLTDLEIVNPDDFKKFDALKKYVKEELEMSDKVINQNLLQFKYSKEPSSNYNY